MTCRHCGFAVELTLVDLGTAPPSNSYLTKQALKAPEKWFPLRVLVCERCWLVQTEDFARAEELFSADYAYFSGFSSSWLAHCEAYVTDMVARFGLGPDSRVTEVAANDGYLLQYVQARNIPCTGVEPTAATAAAARARGIPVVEDFFGLRLAQELASQGKQADLTFANNVLAHVPDINDFTAGLAILLAPQGVLTVEFPHLLRLIEQTQFDTIYHEHFSYLSLIAVEAAFAAGGLRAFDVEELPTHGGSLRLYACRAGAAHRESERLGALRARERAAGLDRLDAYRGFAPRVEAVKRDFLAFLAAARGEGKRVAAYGAAAKGNTFLNVCGIGADDILCVFDRSPAKQGRLLPGSHIPILAPERLADVRPDYLIVLPWNLLDELRSQTMAIAEWGGRWVIALPRLRTIAP